MESILGRPTKPTTHAVAPARSKERKVVLRASVGEPQLLDVSSAVLYRPLPSATEDSLPELPLDTPEPDPPPVTSAEELQALLKKVSADGVPAVEEPEAMDQPGPETENARKEEPTELSDEAAERAHFGVILSEEALIFQHARSCLEDLAMLGLMRRPLPGQSWTGRSSAERRLLARIDAIVSLEEGVLPGLLRLLEDRPMPDPELTWAILFLFGSIAGDGALEQLRRVARAASFESAQMRESIADALTHAPHPGIDAAMREWLSDADACRREIAVVVLARRRTITSAEACHAALDRELSVVSAAAHAIGNAAGATDPKIINKLLHHESQAVVRAALESSVLIRSALGVNRARAIARNGRPEFADAALFWAIGSDSRDLSLFQEIVSKTDSPIFLQAVGWFGHPQLIAPLLGALRTGSDQARAAALTALQRITGASLTDDEPDPEYEKDNRPFRRPFTPPVIADKLSLKADVWTSWWKKHQATCEMTVRYRFGQAGTPEHNLWEMEDSLSSQPDRWLLPRTRRSNRRDQPLRSESLRRAAAKADRALASALERAAGPGRFPGWVAVAVGRIRWSFQFSIKRRPPRYG